MYLTRQNLRKLVAIAICFVSSSIVSAQDVITLKNGDNNQVINQSPQFELSYYNGVLLNGVRIKPDQVKSILSVNSEALKLYKSGRSLYIVGQVIAYPSAFCLGYDLGARLAGGKGNGAVLGIGVGGTLVGLIMSFSGDAKMKSSVKLYNSKTENTASIHFGMTQTGVGLCMHF